MSDYKSSNSKLLWLGCGDCAGLGSLNGTIDEYLLVDASSGSHLSIPENYDLADLVAGTAIHDEQPITQPTFSFESSLRLIERNGLLLDLVNSHLFVCRKERPIFEYKPNVLASYYSPKRYKTTRQSIEFVDEGGKILTKRMKFDQEGSPHISTEQMLTGFLYSNTLSSVLQKENWQAKDLVPLFQFWLDELDKYKLDSIESDNSSGTNRYLSGCFLDAIPRNMIVDSKKQAQFIDLEWNYSSEIPFELVAYRGIAVTLGAITSIAQPKDPVFISRISLVKFILKELGLDTDYSTLRSTFNEVNHHFAICFSSGSLDEKSSVEEFINLPNFTVRGHKKEQAATLSEASLYWSEEKDAFSEEKTVKKTYQASSSDLFLSLSIPKKPIVSLRLDIANREGFFILDKCSIESQEGTEIWSLDTNERNYFNVGDMEFISIDENRKIAIKSIGNDPKFTLDLSSVSKGLISAGAVLVIKMSCFF